MFAGCTAVRTMETMPEDLEQVAELEQPLRELATLTLKFDSYAEGFRRA